MKVLLVDDEPHILSGLRRVLENLLDEAWQITLADSGAAALSQIASDPPDIIVSDMRMPRMNGAQLLAEVRAREPRIVRIVLSGQMDEATAICAVPNAHQFLCKPCEPKELVRVLESAAVLRRLLTDDALRAALGSLSTLPAAPASYGVLRAALAVPTTTTAEISAIISRDPALAAKVLQLVNNSFFGVRGEVRNIEEAVRRLGVRTMQTLVFSELLFAAAPRDPPPQSFIDDVRDRAARCAAVASSLAPGMADAAAVAVLSEVGRLVLAVALPAVITELETREGPWCKRERDRLGVTHAEIGAFLLGLWGLPLVLVDAVAHHHAPGRATGESRMLAAVAHVADAFVSGEPIDEEGLAAIDMLEEATLWMRALRRSAAA